MTGVASARPLVVGLNAELLEAECLLLVPFAPEAGSDTAKGR